MLHPQDARITMTYQDELQIHGTLRDRNRVSTR